MNIIVVSGRLTETPELKTSANGISVCSTRIAVPRSFGENKETDFFNVVFWRGQAETVSKYCKKGDKLFIGGHIQSRDYQDKNGNKRTAYEIIVEKFEFGSAKTEQKNVDVSSEDDVFPFN